jgi:ssDNA-binding Zn-finger/Zn-ribbon topoisomerase 1
MNGKGGVKRRAMKGKCPDCGTTMFRILGKKD